MPKSIVRPLCFVTWLLAASPGVRAEDWPCWRGPRGDGSSNETNLPVRWSAEQNIVWNTELPGEGHSSPIVWGDRVFTVTALLDTQERVLVCLDRKAGEIVWLRTVVKSPPERKHKLNSFASSTPATDGKFVYVTFLDQHDMVVAAYDFDGSQQWLVRPGQFSSVHGFCSSPVLFKDKVIVNGDHDGDAYLVALDRATGKTLWKIARENRTRSYCTPIIRDIGGRTQMLLSGNKCVASYDPHDGSRHWIVDGPTEQFVASLVFNRGLVFVTGGYPDHHILAIKPDGLGNVSDSHIVWHDTKGVSYVPSPIADGDYFLIVSDDGIASCLDAATGKRLWMQRIGKHYSASLVSAGGLVYFLDDDGVTTVVKPGPEFELIARNDLCRKPQAERTGTIGSGPETARGPEPHEQFSASPAISRGQIFLRSDKHLFCIGSRAAAAEIQR